MEEDFISIHAVDPERQEAFQIKVSVAEFAEALFGRIYRPCEYGFRQKAPHKPQDAQD